MKAIVLVTALVVGAMGQASASEGRADLGLEPCINGDVSASGLYETQAHEDRAKALARDATSEKEGKGRPCQEVVKESDS